jgi:formate/nitrite transporter FocA (FNT family)
MNMKQKDRLLTGLVIAIVAAMLIAFAAVIYLYGQGSVDDTAFMLMSSALSSGLFIVVIIYGAITLKGQNVERYKQFEEEYKKRHE